MHLLFFLLGFALLPIVTSTCARLPEVETLPNGYTRLDFTEKVVDGKTLLMCIGRALSQFDVEGPMVAAAVIYICDLQNNKLLPFSSESTVPLNATCTDHVAGLDMCQVTYETSAGPTEIATLKPDNLLCPPNRGMLMSDGTPVKSFSCDAGKYDIELTNGTILSTNNLRLKCQDPPTTTTTKRPTTTTLPRTTTTSRPTTTTLQRDSNPTTAQLWNVNYYYNYGFGVHAFCADQTCINSIQSNGIGYDMNNGKGLMGKAVTESAISAVRSSCPTGSQQLRNLGFTKSGYKYLHNLDGVGLKLGWVATVNGACGATVPIKRWKSRYTDDMMYGVDLEWNTWYNGMVQDGGKVQFYMFN